VPAQLSERSLSEEIREALEEHLEARRTDPELGERAKDIAASIEQEAQARQAAITTLFGQAKQRDTGRPQSKAKDGAEEAATNV
jgi:hypothetical protein